MTPAPTWEKVSIWKEDTIYTGRITEGAKYRYFLITNIIILWLFDFVNIQGLRLQYLAIMEEVSTWRGFDQKENGGFVDGDWEFHAYIVVP